MKYLDFGPPDENSMDSYPQRALLLDRPGGSLIDSIMGSTAPNPRIPGNPDRPNLSEYPIVHPGTYLGIFHEDRHHGKPCISLNDDGPVWILQDKNPRTGAEHSAIGIRVHSGWRESWRGSAGCMTLDPGEGDFFLRTNFEEGEQVAIYIPNQDWFAKG